MASTLDGNAKAMNLNPCKFKLWSPVTFPLANRYHQAGPQKTLFIPGPILKVGLNEIVIFDTYGGGQVPHEIFPISISSLEISHGSFMPSLIWMSPFLRLLILRTLQVLAILWKRSQMQWEDRKTKICRFFTTVLDNDIGSSLLG